MFLFLWNIKVQEMHFNLVNSMKTPLPHIFLVRPTPEVSRVKQIRATFHISVVLVCLSFVSVVI